MSRADWHPDPTRPGRLRYWDGTGWTEWVSEDGQTRSDPLGAAATLPPPAPLPDPPSSAPQGAGAPIASGSHPIVAGGAASADLVARIGLGIMALSGVVGTASLGRVLVSQERRFSGAERVIDVEPGVWACAAAAVLLAVATGLPYLWARLTGVGIGSALAVSMGLSVFTSRNSDRFSEEGPSVMLGAGGWILFSATLVGLVGLAVSLAGVQLIARSRPRPSGGGEGVAALVLGIAGVLIPYAQALAVAFGLLGMGGVGSRPDGARTGSGLALAGFVLGVPASVLWWLLIVLGMLIS
jgi:hypothetical protein